MNGECWKVAYSSWPDANKALVGTRRNRGSRHNRHERNIYMCGACGFWHLTSKTLR